MKQLLSGQAHLLKACLASLCCVALFTACSPSTTVGSQQPGTGQNSTSANITTNRQVAQVSGSSTTSSIEFYGKVQSIDANNITVHMPNGDAITAALSTLTKREDLNAGEPTVGQLIEMKVIANPDGTFLAKKLEGVKPERQSNQARMATVDFKGTTTSAVGADNVVHFKVGNKSYSFTINPATTWVKDFLNPQAIGANQPVELEVQFDGSNGTIIEIENGIDD
ncbi:MAG TPA: DUF5666 domain-containing protein [Ktedonosporobacter sp.]|nr:DUF5666 domain-containing protein [Ktedonosporobacter sp.]